MNTYQKLKSHLPFIGVIFLLNLASAQPTFGTEGEKSRSGGGIISSTEEAGEDALSSFLVSNTTWSTEKHLGFEANGAMVSGTTSGTSTGSTGGTTSGSTGGTSTGSTGGGGWGSTGGGSGGVVCNVQLQISNLTQETCDGNLNRQLVAEANSGNTPYTFNWSTGAASDTVSVIASGTFRVTVTDSLGCTRSASINLNTNSPFYNTSAIAACGGYVWLQNGTNYSQSGLYYDTIQNTSRCDSIYILDLTINAPPNPSILQGDSLSFCSTDSARLSAAPQNGYLQWQKVQNVDWEELDSVTTATGAVNIVKVAVSASGITYIAYIDQADSSSIAVARYDNGNWTLVGNKISSDVQLFDMEVDPNGAPHVAFSEFASPRRNLKVVRFDGANWVTLGTGTEFPVNPQNIELEFDSQGSAFVGFVDNSIFGKYGVVKYFSTAWQRLDSSGVNDRFATDHEFAVSPSGVPYLVYIDENASGVAVVKTYNGSSWVTAGGSSITSSRVRKVTIDVGPNNTPYIAFQNGRFTGDILAKSFDGIRWNDVGVNVVSSNNYSSNGGVTKLKVNNNGVLYYVHTNSNSIVKTYRFKNLIWEEFAGPDYSRINGSRHDINIGVNGFPIFSFQTSIQDGQHPIIVHYPIEILSNQANLITNEPGTYVFSVMNANGCSANDSIILIDNGTTTVNQFDTANGSYTWSRTGITYDTSGIYTFTKTDTATCDSLFQLNLTIEGPLIATISDTACGPYLWAQNGMTYTSGGNYADTLQNNSGGDSLVITLNLTINPLPNVSIAQGNTAFFCAGDSLNLTLNGTADNYEWYRDVWVNVGQEGFSAGKATNQSLVIDQGVPYVAFIDQANSNAITVMKYNGSSWVNVGTAAFSSTFISDFSFSVDQSVPYVAFRDNFNGAKATVMKYDGSNWVNVGSAGFTNAGINFPSIIIEQGEPHLAFQDLDNNSKSSLMKYNGSNWVHVGAPGFSADAGHYQSLTSDQGTLYLAFADASSSFKTTVMKYNGSNWVNVGQAGFSDGQARYHSLKVEQGVPYVAYSDFANSQKITVKTYDGSNWSTLGQTGFSAALGSLAEPSLDVKDSVPYLAYRDADNFSRTTVVKYNGTSWVNIGQVGITPAVSAHQSLAIDQGNIYVAYQDAGKADKTSVIKFGTNAISNQSSYTVTEAGEYYLLASDNNSCSSNDTIVVREEPLPAITFTIDTAISCIGNSDAKIRATVTNGAAPHTYSWSTGSTSNGIRQVGAGTYYLTLTNANGCIKVDSITLSDPTAISPTITAQTNVSCNFGNDGSLTAMTSGGTGRITYLWSNGDTSAIASNLSAGVYTVTVTDANGCAASLTDTITQPSVLGSTKSSFTNVSCNGGTNGKINFEERGGTSPYKYLWSNGDTTANITGLPAGSYTISVTDANNCGPSTRTITISEPSALSMRITFQKNISCNGGNDGQFRALASGGTGSLTYLWSNGETFHTADNLSAGVYTVTATDANGCTATLTDTITEPSLITGSQTETACDSFSWAINSTVYTQSGTYVDTAIAVSGCDSVVTLNLTILNSTSETFSADVCNTYDWQGMTFTQTGTYFDTIPNAAACDSLMTLNLIIRNETSETFTADVCKSYDWQGMTFTTTGTYYDTIPNAAACDSLMTLNLTIRNETNETFTADVCKSYDWQGMTFTQTGTYFDTISNAAACDSLMTLNLIIRNETSETFSADVCNSYDWQGMTFTTTGTYFDTISNAVGCDSLMTLNLTIRNETSETFTADVCNSYDWQGMTFTQSGTYFDTIPNAAACDSLMTLNLIIRNETSETFTADVCNSYDWQGMTFTTSGTYYDTIPNVAACDSLMTLNLIIRNETSETFTADVCNTYDWQGMTFTTTGTYFDTIPNAAGCDSLMTLNLIIRNETSETFSADVCNSYDWQGMTFTQTGTYFDTIPNAAGCDSLMTLNLIIRNETSETFSADVCNSYDWQGMTFTQSGTYYDTIPNAAACDSLMTLNLIIRNETSETFSADVCNSYDWQGMTFTQTGTYFDTIQNAAACDSLMTLNLIIRNKTSETFSADVCNSYDWQGMTFTTTGTYYDTIPNAAGCDSLMTLNLIIRNKTSETFSADVCNSYDWQGMTFTTSGTYYDTIPNAAGCDSLMTLNLIIRNETSETFTADVCNTYDWQGMTFTTTGTYYDTIPNAAACDSLMTLNLIIRNETSETFAAAVCNSYDWQGMTFTQTGTYFDTIPNAAACDSLMTLNLIIRNETSETFSADVCNSYDWQGMTFTQTGTYFDTIQNAAGCDSLMTLNLIVNYTKRDTIAITACDSYTWVSNGQTYSTSGIYSDTLFGGAASGCDSISTLDLSIDEIVIAEAGSNQQFCELFGTTLNATAIPIGSGNWRTIAGSGTFANVSDPTTNVSGMQLGTNSFEWVVVNGACPAAMDTVQVVVNKNPIADAGPDLETRDIEPVQIQATAVDAASISWTPFFSLSDATVEKPIANPQGNTDYRMEVTSNEGCTASDEMEITVNTVMKLDATTLFSPNGDGMNDTWVVNKPELIQGCQLIIVNRNGTEVYSTNQYNNEWDGKIGGTQLPEGTYYYIFDCTDGRTLKGPITILRERR